MNEYAIGQSIGGLIGALIGLLIAVIIIKVCNTNKKYKTEYDERQQIMIGKSYKYAMITTWVALALLIFIELSEIELPLTNPALVAVVLFISVLVFASYAIWTDAYWGTNSNIKRYTLALIIIGLVNLLATIAFFVNGSLFEDGKLGFSSLNLFCTILFAVIAIELLAKKAIDNNSNSDEEDADEES